MNAKDLERLLASHGANPYGVDAVVRKLRDSFKVKISVSGRGFNAHDLTADEMSWIVATYVGSEVPARASETLARLLKLRAVDSEPKDFILCFRLILSRDTTIKGVREIRIARNADFAQIIFHEGAPWTFTNRRAPGATPPAFRSEGVLSAVLIDILAANLVVEENSGDDKVIEAQE